MAFGVENAGRKAVEEAIPGAKDVIDHFFAKLLEFVQKLAKALASIQ